MTNRKQDGPPQLSGALFLNLLSRSFLDKRTGCNFLTERAVIVWIDITDMESSYLSLV